MNAHALHNERTQLAHVLLVLAEYVLEVAERRQLEYDGERLDAEANHGHNVLVSQAADDGDLLARDHVRFGRQADALAVVPVLVERLLLLLVVNACYTGRRRRLAALGAQLVASNEVDLTKVALHLGHVVRIRHRLEHFDGHLNPSTLGWRRLVRVGFVAVVVGEVERSAVDRAERASAEQRLDAQLLLGDQVLVFDVVEGEIGRDQSGHLLAVLGTHEARVLEHRVAYVVDHEAVRPLHVGQRLGHVARGAATRASH